MPWSKERRANAPRPPLAAGSYKLTAKVWWELSQARPPDPAKRRDSVYIESDPLTLEIAPPAGVDAEAVKLLRASELEGFFEGILGGRPQPVEEFLSKYPDSTHARYARVRLALDRMRWFWDTKRTGLSAAEKDEVRELAASAYQLAGLPDFQPMADNLLLFRARMQRIDCDPRGAARTLLCIVARYPDSDAREAAEKRLAEAPPELRDLPPEPPPPVSQPRQPSEATKAKAAQPTQPGTTAPSSRISGSGARWWVLGLVAAVCVVALGIAIPVLRARRRSRAGR